MRKATFILCLAFSLVACEYITEVEDISQKTVTILAPTNEAILNEEAINFTWEAIEAAEHYHLQIATPAFENANQIVFDTLLPKTNHSVNLSVGNYEWRIRAENSGYMTAYTKQRFSIEE